MRGKFGKLHRGKTFAADGGVERKRGKRGKYFVFCVAGARKAVDERFAPHRESRADNASDGFVGSVGGKTDIYDRAVHVGRRSEKISPHVSRNARRAADLRRH